MHIKIQGSSKKSLIEAKVNTLQSTFLISSIVNICEMQSEYTNKIRPTLT